VKAVQNYKKYLKTQNMEIKKITKNLGTLIIKPVDKAMAKEMIVKNHYSHKWNDASFGKYIYGVFCEENPDKCLGVAVYGYMKNTNAQIFTHPNPHAWICELNRMWIDDCLGHNAETVLIGASLKLLQKADKNLVAVQSFADGRLGCGTIYKAANFKYFGVHYTRFLRHKKTDVVEHEQNFTNSKTRGVYLSRNIGWVLRYYTVSRVKTYRYIYIFDRKNLKLRWKEQPYPLYERGEEPCEWERDNNKIIDTMCHLLQELKTKK
jgi:hypothetical protein